uniref:NADH dehydrogenase subunit 6 n=1 Tax=Tropidomya abbreviata TaxID=102404 RepID=A0A1U9XPJ6_9BIVA|nr:NADH dehydrogenase subunit 6 [Tropidomya abbreviata]AQZ26179.1 NADH dehydrogenase subunit 6 [Tropidomya abbreviata]
MIIFFFTMLVVTLVSFLSMVSNPLNIGVVVLLLSMIFSWMISLSMSSWYGCILFIIYVGGLLVMFSYAVVLASNPVAKVISWEVLLLELVVLLVFLVELINQNPKLEFLVDLLKHSMFWDGVMLSVSSGSLSLIGLVIYLFLCLVLVVKISMFLNSPFRSFSSL